MPDPTAEQVAWATMVVGEMNRRHFDAPHPSSLALRARTWMNAMCLAEMLAKRESIKEDERAKSE